MIIIIINAIGVKVTSQDVNGLNFKAIVGVLQKI
jgi:hypothetical protein